MLTGRCWGPYRCPGVQTKRRPHTQQILHQTLRSVSSAPPETITFSLRDFFWSSQPPLQRSGQKAQGAGGGVKKKKIPLDKARPLRNFQRPSPFVQLPGGKVQRLGPPPAHSLIWWRLVLMSCGSVCKISATQFVKTNGA